MRFNVRFSEGKPINLLALLVKLTQLKMSTIGYINIESLVQIQKKYQFKKFGLFHL